MRVGRHDAAAAELSRALLGWALVQKGRNADGLEALKLGGRADLAAGLTIASLARAGRLGEAKALLASAEADACRRYVDPYALAIGYTGIGDMRWPL